MYLMRGGACVYLPSCNIQGLSCMCVCVRSDKLKYKSLRNLTTNNSTTLILMLHIVTFISIILYYFWVVVDIRVNSLICKCE